MKSTSIEDFNYDLPDELIAQSPLKDRDQSKLLVYDKTLKTIKHTQFFNIINYLNTNDILVFNDTKVIKSRVFTKRNTGGKIEVFFLEKINNQNWEVLLKKSHRLKINEVLTVDKDNQIKIIEKKDKTAIVSICSPIPDLDFLEKFGNTPLPPYIKNDRPNKYETNYQTVFASKPGAVAAPTASLHFTNNLLAQLSTKKIEIIYITLHIGLGTFNPIQSKNIYDHKMHKENYYISPESAKKLNTALKNKKRIIGVGTTVARCLESNISNNEISSGANTTNLYIKPGDKLKCISGIITNFHLPKSSLLILIASIVGVKEILNIYEEAINKQYRFFSFGDAMLIT